MGVNDIKESYTVEIKLKGLLLSRPIYYYILAIKVTAASAAGSTAAFTAMSAALAAFFVTSIIASIVTSVVASIVASVVPDMTIVIEETHLRSPFHIVLPIAIGYHIICGRP